MTVKTDSIQNLHELISKLPSPEQLEAYRILKVAIEASPDKVPLESKLAFARLVLVEPYLLEGQETDLVQKICTEEWRRYCDSQWGTPEQQPKEINSEWLRLDYLADGHP
jgi:hypothetical protein